ncbi:MAG: tetratricopeptide repeat protein [Candidatus Aminicenantes bacterium]
MVQNQLQFGIEAAQKDLWDEAIFRWKKVIAHHPQSAAAHNNLAVAYEKKGWWEEAKKEYEIALKLNPDNSYIESNYEKFKKNQELSKKEKTKNEKN